MEYIRKIHSLTNFLSGVTVTGNQICRYVTLDSCAELQPISSVLAQLKNDGSFLITGVFGLKSDAVSTFEKITLAKNSMIAESVRTNRVHINGTLQELQSHQLNSNDEQFVGRAAHLVIIPVLEYGVMLLFTAQEPDIDSTLELFLIAVSAMVALNRQNPDLSKIVSIAPKFPGILDKVLTSRQLAIVEGMKHGHTNATIALDIGYSESLIRQETIDIFKKLGVSGRKELLEQDREHVFKPGMKSS
jgi:DNA-binding CsgD family transcriptional regulator